MKKKVSFVPEFLFLLVNILLFVRLTNIAGGAQYGLEIIFKGAMSGTTQLENIGKFFQDCHSYSLIIFGF